MKILRIVYDWPEPWAGLSPHPYEVTVTQAKKGHEVTVFAGKWPNSGRMIIPENVSVVGFMREPLRGTISLTTSVCLFFYYLKWRRSNVPDIIHSHGHFAIWIYLYRLFLRKFFPNSLELKIPLIVHFHNTTEGRKQKLLEKKTTISPISKYVSWPLSTLSDKWAIKAADAFVFVGQELVEEAKKYYNAPSEKCFVIESGVNDTLFKPVGGEEKEKTRKDLGFDPTDTVILNVGMMVERKNIDKLILSLKHLPSPYKILLVGPGDPEYLKKLDQIIHDNHLTDRVMQSGYASYPEVPIAMQAADIFVLPSSFEGTPKVVMEALSCGVPVLASGFKLTQDISGLKYLDKTDPQFIAESIQAMLANPPFVDREKIYREYSWSSRVQKLEEIYESVKKNS
ncbi:glycosyltransferase family 4 protein [Patescibacteria group bacterium]|nr:glycosyltransferase family 4 protein [Patescibacteria group bacterium]HOM77590.1 glycosyltransferase family 4 protein [bacterium]